MCVVICIDSRSTSISLQVCGSCSCFLRRTTVLHFSFLALSLLPSPPPSSPGRFCVAGRVGGFSAEEPFQRLPEVGAACSARQWHHHCTLWTKDLTAGWCGEEITCTSINLQEVYSVYSNAKLVKLLYTLPLLVDTAYSTQYFYIILGHNYKDLGNFVSWYWSNSWAK